MTRDVDMDALAEAVAQARADRLSWVARLARRFLVRAIGPAIFAGGVATLLVKLGVDLGSLLMPMFYATPFIVVAVASFMVVAWRQNTGLTYTPPVGQVDLAEPGPAQPGLVGAVGYLASPAQSATVTVTVLPSPVAALPQAAGQTAPIPYGAEEETR